MQFWILPYKEGSESVRMIKEVMGIKAIKLEGSQWQNKEGRVVINWGNSHPHIEGDITWLNPPEQVKIASDKLLTFNFLSQEEAIPLVEFTTDIHQAIKWKNDGFEVVGRQVLNGYGGRGIIFIGENNFVPTLPLYTKYKPKKSEFRVHYVEGSGVIKIQRKAREIEVPNQMVNWKIRNKANGFIYALANDLSAEHYHEVGRIAKEVFTKMQLHFGCIDVIYNQKEDKFYVLEVNSAPGLSPNTAEAYVKAFRNFYEQEKEEEEDAFIKWDVGFIKKWIEANPVV